MDHVDSAAYVTKLDLLKGYLQVPLTPWNNGNISICVSIPRCFSTVSYRIRSAQCACHYSEMSGCGVYLDDTVVYSGSWDDHVEQLRVAFERLADANLTLNLSVRLAKPCVPGETVGEGQVKPIQSKVEAAMTFTVFTPSHPGVSCTLFGNDTLLQINKPFCCRFSTHLHCKWHRNGSYFVQHGSDGVEQPLC